VSLSPTVRAQILHLHHVEGVSAILIATMTGLSVSVVSTVVEKSRPEDVLAVDRPKPWRPSSKGRIERQISAAYAALLKKGASRDRT
jgi:hypothetical protein